MMMTRSQKLAPRLHLPLRRLALCLDCDECFEVGCESCPACGSETWASLGRFLEMGRSRLLGADETRGVRRRRDEGDIGRHLLIVARNRVQLYEQLKQAFAGQDKIQVVLDRRNGERRPVRQERRRSERGRASIEEQLRAIGWAIVLLDFAKTQRIAAGADRS